MSDSINLHLHDNGATIEQGIAVDAVFVQIEKPGVDATFFFHDEEPLTALIEAATIARERLHVANLSRRFGEDRAS